MKKVLSFLLALVLVLGQTVTAFAADSLTITSHADGEVVCKSKIRNLTWNRVSGAAGYRITVKNENTGEYFTRNEWVSKTTYNLQELFDQTLGNDYPLLKIWVGAMHSSKEAAVYAFTDQIIFLVVSDTPMISNLRVLNLKSNSATFCFSLDRDFGVPIDASGIYLGQSSKLNKMEFYAAANSTTKGVKEITVPALAPETTYYVRGCARNAAGETITDAISFTTYAADNNEMPRDELSLSDEYPQDDDESPQGGGEHPQDDEVNSATAVIDLTDSRFNRTGSYLQSDFYKNLESVRLTGDYAEDIVAVALSQVGYQEVNGQSAYGLFYNNTACGADGAWCAYFICFASGRGCVPNNVISFSASANPGVLVPNGEIRFLMPRESYESKISGWKEQKKSDGTLSFPWLSSTMVSFMEQQNYVPEKGDLIFWGSTDWRLSFTHVGLVTEVNGKTFSYIDGNGSGDDVSLQKNCTASDLGIIAFARPNYSGSGVTEVKTSYKGGAFVVEETDTGNSDSAVLPEAPKTPEANTAPSSHGNESKGTPNSETSVQTTISGSTAQMGDVNGDGYVDSMDTNLLFRYANEDPTLGELSTEQLLAADTNQDGYVDSMDTNILFRYANEDKTLSWCL